MKRLRLWVVNYLTRHLLKAVTKEEVLLIAGKEWLIGKRKLSHEEILDLKEDAQILKASNLWKLIVKELKYRITLQRLDQAKSIDDMTFGKAMAYDLQLIEDYLDTITKV